MTPAELSTLLRFVANAIDAQAERAAPAQSQSDSAPAPGRSYQNTPEPHPETIPQPPASPVPAAVQAAPVQAAPVQAAPVQAAPVQAAPVQAAPTVEEAQQYIGMLSRKITPEQQQYIRSLIQQMGVAYISQMSPEQLAGLMAQLKKDFPDG